MMPMPPPSQDGRPRDDEPPAPTRGIERRSSRAGAREGPNLPTEAQIQDAAAQALATAVIPRKHVIFPDPVAFRYAHSTPLGLSADRHEQSMQFLTFFIFQIPRKRAIRFPRRTPDIPLWVRTLPGRTVGVLSKITHSGSSHAHGRRQRPNHSWRPRYPFRQYAMVYETAALLQSCQPIPCPSKGDWHGSADGNQPQQLSFVLDRYSGSGR